MKIKNDRCIDYFHIENKFSKESFIYFLNEFESRFEKFKIKR